MASTMVECSDHYDTALTRVSDDCEYVKAGRSQGAHMRKTTKASAADDDAGQPSSPAAFATIDSIVYCPTTNTISTSAGGS